MKTVLAYIIVVVSSQFCLTAGMLAAIPFAFLLAWVPERFGAPLRTFLGGIVASVLTVGFAYLIFKWLVGSDSFGIIPFLAATMPLSIPIYNDYQKGRLLSDTQDEAPSARVAAIMDIDVSAMKAVVLGEIAGLVVAAILFL